MKNLKIAMENIALAGSVFFIFTVPMIAAGLLQKHPAYWAIAFVIGLVILLTDSPLPLQMLSCSFCAFSMLLFLTSVLGTGLGAIVSFIIIVAIIKLQER